MQTLSKYPFFFLKTSKNSIRICMEMHKTLKDKNYLEAKRKKQDAVCYLPLKHVTKTD